MTETSPPSTRIQNFLIHDRDILISRASFQPLFQELELHTLAQGIFYDPFATQILCDALTALGLFLGFRPGDEFVAWTISIQEPAVNLFVAGNPLGEQIVGRAFLEGVQPQEANLFIAQVQRGADEPRTSTIEVSGFDPFAMVESLHRQSEQRPVRYFHTEDQDFLLLTLPETDIDWFEGVELQEVLPLLEHPSLRKLNTRPLQYRCGCNREKIAAVLAKLYENEPETLFAGQAHILVECPRCGARLEVSRSEFDETSRNS